MSVVTDIVVISGRYDNDEAMRDLAETYGFGDVTDIAPGGGSNGLHRGTAALQLNLHVTAIRHCGLGVGVKSWEQMAADVAAAPWADPESVLILVNYEWHDRPGVYLVKDGKPHEVLAPLPER